jgi:hypothetical protein
LISLEVRMFRWIATSALGAAAGCVLTVPVLPPDSGVAAASGICRGALLEAPVDARLAVAVVASVRGRMGGDVAYAPEDAVVTRGPGPACGYEDVDAAAADEARFREALVAVDPAYADAGSLVDACPCRSDEAHQSAAKEAPRL